VRVIPDLIGIPVSSYLLPTIYFFSPVYCLLSAINYSISLLLLILLFSRDYYTQVELFPYIL
jgi:hypothetical protein